MVVYPVPMGNGSAQTWGKWLRRTTDREGWSIARLARESGFNPSTISEWIRYQDGSYVKVRDVVTVARAAGEDPVEALCAAAGIDAGGEADPEIKALKDSLAGLPDNLVAEVIRVYLARRDRDQERDRERRLQDTSEIVRLVEGQTAT